MKKINCILLVDDNPADNEFHKIIIKDSNVCDNVKIAINGDKALEYIIKSGNGDNPEYPKPDLIFLDINMPGMNGFEFLEEYHSLDPKLKSKIVIIMLSTSLNPDDAERAGKIEEVTEFMNKPLMVDTLKTTIDKYF
ncbi:MAG TPA: response regulator [Bacteroidia bacterium]|jgi:CheY-like chemotaxis protein|nr:response regulator [Bacteroidia bacterium]